MTPEVEETAPDPVTDDEAYRALCGQRWKLDSEYRRVSRERDLLRQERVRQRIEVMNAKYAAKLAEQYPNPIPDQIYRLAQETAYDPDDMSADEKDFDEIASRYSEIVDLINAATKEYRDGLRNILNLHGGSIDPTECMECDMKADAHQLAPKNFPCRTLAEAHRVLG